MDLSSDPNRNHRYLGHSEALGFGDPGLGHLKGRIKAEGSKLPCCASDFLTNCHVGHC